MLRLVAGARLYARSLQVPQLSTVFLYTCITSSPDVIKLILHFFLALNCSRIFV